MVPIYMSKLKHSSNAHFSDNRCHPFIPANAQKPLPISSAFCFAGRSAPEARPDAVGTTQQRERYEDDPQQVCRQDVGARHPLYKGISALGQSFLLDLPIHGRHRCRRVAADRHRTKLHVSPCLHYDRHRLLDSQLPDRNDMQHEPATQIDATPRPADGEVHEETVRLVGRRHVRRQTSANSSGSKGQSSK